MFENGNFVLSVNILTQYGRTTFSWLHDTLPYLDQHVKKKGQNLAMKYVLAVSQY